MRKLVLALLVAGLAGVAAAQPPRELPSDDGYGSELPEGAANLDFILVNRTGETITAVSIRPSGEDSPWSADILVQREVPSGERAAVSYTRDIELCRWDVRATYANGDRRTWPLINLCRTVRVELR